MLKFIEKTKEKPNSDWDIFVFNQTEGTSLGDRYFWVLSFDIYEFNGDWIDYFKTPEDIAFHRKKEIPKNFEVYKIKGYSPYFKSKIQFYYYKNGTLELKIKNKTNDISEEQVIEYLNTIYTNHFYYKGFEDGYAKCNKDNNGAQAQDVIGVIKD